MTKYAIALYDNDAESDEELNFRKNDVLQVKQIDFMGMQGWWLCKLVKDNRTGLAPGNRLKITNDENLISKYLTIKPNKTNLVLNSNSNSLTSFLSDKSTSSSNSQACIEQMTNAFDYVSIQTESPIKIVLPAKNKTTPSSLFTLKSSNYSSESNYNTLKKTDEDDYDYDIPENNRPTSKLIKELEDSRKSISPTIDSGISTSSLISLNLTESPNSVRSSLNQRISNYSNFEEPKLKQDLKLDFDDKIEKLNHLITNIETFNSNQILISDNMTSLKSILSEFLSQNLKILKQEHACFHPELNTFNQFRTLVEKLENFEFFTEKFEMNKLGLFKELLQEIKILVEEKKIFDYDCETRSLRSSGSDDNNEYEYENNQNEGDYCEIDDLEEEKCLKVNRGNLEKLVEKVSNTSALCMTLKRSDEKIRKEIKLATSLSDCESYRINMSDQMLLKFYLKHIEENFSDLKIIYDVLIDKLTKNSIFEVDLANKLALNGHKLVFICDTLEQNINNEILKINLYDLSSHLCNSLKNYMFKIKSSTGADYQVLIDSLNNVYKSAHNFKQIVLKNVFK
ncbi:unnamed protein product [Brachionus calyciflorus]|uniref:SH3 domain-containing protein n=1 Tax=Brachionus calyciflorus TaxID=104777 RepID=A0A814DBW0_9BILA|nr:unnamed protein product [Brachionus calyciflorus]